MPPVSESDYPEAFQLAGRQLDACMQQSGLKGFRWIKMLPSKPAFADLVFGFGGRMYAVLLVAMSRQRKVEGGHEATFDIPRDRLQLLVTECSRHALEPVVFPLWPGVMQPLTDGWNLFSPVDSRAVVPTDEAELSRLPVPMSRCELFNFCMQRVLHEIRDNRGRILAFGDLPEALPHLWFEDAEGHRAWLVVAADFGTALPHLPGAVAELRSRLPRECSAYVARMAVESAAHPGAHPQRGEVLRIHYSGMERIS